MRNVLYMGIGSFLFFLILPYSSHTEAQSTIVTPLVETGSSHHSGDTADDSVIWIHPTDPSQSVVIGDDKNGGMMVWNLDGSELQYLDGTKLLNNVDLRYNFPLRGTYSDGTTHTHVALVVVGNENGGSLSIYKMNPAPRKLEPVSDYKLSIGTPYGGCMYHSPVTGKYYYFVNWKSGVWQQIELADNGSGGVGGAMVRSADAGGQTEGCTTDDVHKQYYIGEEAAGVWRYGAEPGDGGTRTQMDKTGGGGNLSADVEGISLYYRSDGGGYLIVSSQGNSTIQVYNRQVPNAYIGTFSVGANGSIDATSGTDGLDVTNYPLGSQYPKGLLVVHDASNTGGSASNHKLVPFDRVAGALTLATDTTWDPRRVGSGSGPNPPNTPNPLSSPTSTPLPTATTRPQASPTPLPPVTYKIPGDITDDGNVNSLDYVILFEQFGLDNPPNTRADLDRDGRVTALDYVILFEHFGQSIHASPPPTTTRIPTHSPTPAGPTPIPTVGGPTPTFPPVVAGEGIWISPSEIARLPISGSAWTNLNSAADGSWGTADLANQDSHHPQYALAGALVYARTGQVTYRIKTADAIMGIVGQNPGRSLALGRNLAAYVVSADLIDLKSYDPGRDQQFRAWLSSIRTHVNSEGRSLVSCHEIRPNNWGTMCGASRIAADIYLGDRVDLDQAAKVFRGYLGDRASYAGFKFQSGAFTWMCDPQNPRPINPVGCVKDGHDLSGAPVDDVQRAGTYTWPPNATNYAWGGFSAAVAQAEMLHRAGYPAFDWEQQAVKRGMTFIQESMTSSGSTPTDWIPWVVNYRYHTSFPAKTPTGWGRLMGWTDWTHTR